MSKPGKPDEVYETAHITIPIKLYPRQAKAIRRTNEAFSTWIREAVERRLIEEDEDYLRENYPLDGP